jgi:hypothetical protein
MVEKVSPIEGGWTFRTLNSEYTLVRL